MASINKMVFDIEVSTILRRFYATLASTSLAGKEVAKALGSTNRMTTAYGKVFPFSYIDCDTVEMQASLIDLDYRAYLSCIVELNTAVENWAYGALERLYLLNFEKFKVDESSLPIAQIIIQSEGTTMKIGLCRALVQAKLRQRNTIQMIEFVAKAIPVGLGKRHSAMLDAIKTYSLLRNSIVHNQSRVSFDLFGNCGNRFGRVNRKLEVTHWDVTDFYNKMFAIVKDIDKRYCSHIIKDSDIIAFIHELFVNKGYDENTILEILNQLGFRGADKQLVHREYSRARRNERTDNINQIQPSIEAVISHHLR